MALNYDQVTAITEKYILPKTTDNIFDSNILLKRAKTKGWYERIDGGEKIIYPLEYAQLTAGGWYSGADILSTTDNQTITGAEVNWKQLYKNISIRRDEELKNSGKRAIVNLVKSKMRSAEKGMRDDLGTGLFSNATDANSIVGLRQWVATSNSPGGISQSSYSWWQSNVDSSTTTLSLSAMNTVFNDAAIDNDQPTFGVTTRAIHGLYYALLQPQQRFVDSETAKGGFTNLMFNGIPLAIDSHTTAAHLFLLNENYLKLTAHRDEDMRFDGFVKPTNQNVRVAKLYWAGAFGSTNNRMHGLLSAITS